MRKILLLILTILLLQLFGCGKPTMVNDQLILDGTTAANTHASNAASPKKNIALVIKTLTNPYFVDMEKGARKAESELGVNLLVRIGAQETSIEQQINIVNDLISEKVDAIVIAPVHSTELIPILKKAQDAGIIIINVDNRLDPMVSKEMGLINVPFIGADNEEGAYMAANYLSGKIVKPTEVAVLEGIQGADNSNQRKKGALRAFGENGNVRVIAVETANWKIDEALSVTSRLFKEHPNIGAIYCLNDMMALGAIEYVSKAHKTEVIIGGFDALNEAKEAIRQGKLLVTVNQNADLQGYMGVKSAVQLLQGEKVPMERYMPVQLVNAENIN